MKLKDITEWQDKEVRTIKVMSDVSPVPLELSVRKFKPIAQDCLHKSWMDGKVKKYMETTPFGIVNMSAAVKDMEDYIYKNVGKCAAFFLKGRDSLIQRTYSFAWSYMKRTPVSFSLVSNHLLYS